MPTTITQYTQSQISLEIGSAIAVKGTGLATLTRGRHVGVQQRLLGNTTVGPFDHMQVVDLTATGTDLIYDTAPTAGPLDIEVTATGSESNGVTATQLAGLRTLDVVANDLPYLTKANWSFIDVTNGAFVSDYTQHVQMALEAPFDAVQIGVFNGYSSGTQVSKVAVSVMATAGDPATTAPLNNAGTWVNAGVGGASVTAPAAPVTTFAPGFVFGDVIPIASLDRTDGGTLPLLCVRVQGALADNGGATQRITSNVPCTIANPAYEQDTDRTQIPYGRIYRSRNQGVLGVTTPGLMTTTSNGNGNSAPIVVRYWLRNGVGRTLVIWGDSIPGAYGQTVKNGWNFADEIKRLISTPKQPIEVSKLCLSGSTLGNVAVRAEATASNFKNHTAVCPIGSPNSLAPPITAGGIASERGNCQRILQACFAQNMPLVTWTMLPANFSAKAWGATDPLRIAMNQVRVNNGRAVAPVADFGALAAGPVDVNGQQVLAYAEADGLHPSVTFQQAAGALMAPFFATA